MAKTNPVKVRASKNAEDTGSTGAEAPRAASRARKTGSRRSPRLPASVASAVRVAQSKKASDLVVLDLRKAGGFTDYFVICTGNNTRQINAIADAIRDSLKQEHGERPTLAEGVEKSEWILLDYFNFVVHVFSRECRAFYSLERLWGNAERIEFEEPSTSP